MVYLMVKRLILEPTQLKMIEPKKSNYENTVLVGVVNDSQDEEKLSEFLEELEFLSVTAGGNVVKKFTQKINTGDEPISNTIWGIDANYQNESPLITKLIDKMPLLETKQKSRIVVSGEFAHLIPGHHRAIGKSGVSYIDDFEGTQNIIDLLGCIFNHCFPFIKRKFLILSY